MVLASYAITSTRAKIADFTNPHYCIGGVSLTRGGGPLTGKDMENKILGAEAGTTYRGFIQKLSFEKQLKVFANSEKAVQAVALGTVAATVTDKFAALQARSTYSKANPDRRAAAVARERRYGGAAVRTGTQKRAQRGPGYTDE